MKAKNLIKILFIGFLCISFASSNAQANKKVKQRKHQKVKRHNPHHRYANLPRWGHSYKLAPKNAFIIAHSGRKYHYKSGIYYRKSGAKYLIVKAPVGLRVQTLPKEGIRCVVRGKRYFYYYGTFYKQVDNSDEYITVAPPLGARVNALPEGYKTVEIKGEDLYQFEGTYYKVVIDDNNQELYEVVGEK